MEIRISMYLGYVHGDPQVSEEHPVNHQTRDYASQIVRNRAP
jgi:hypothetical protein